MAKLQLKVPALVHHKPSGQGRVRIAGRDLYCGPWGNEETEARYHQLIADYIATGRVPAAKRAAAEPSSISINELILAFWKHAERHYVHADGTQTTELQGFRSSLRPMREAFGRLPVSEFGPLRLQAVRDAMIRKGWSRKYINKSINRIRHVFKWGVSQEIVDESVFGALRSVAGLRAGRCAAPDYPARQPVPLEHIEAVRQAVRQRTRDLIDLQLLTGARSGELLSVTTAMIDRSGDVWIAKLTAHKTAHHGKDRLLLFGPKAQAILARYVNELSPDRRLFPLQRHSYGTCVKYACRRVGIPVWTPHWLRHNAASRLREEHGLDAAQVMLGHSRIDMTQTYAAKTVSKAIAVARECG